MARYLSDWYDLQRDRSDFPAREAFPVAAEAPRDYLFPNALEEMLALEAAVGRSPADASALFGLGNFYYGRRRHEDAIAAWERSRDADPRFPTAHRNLALAYVNVRGDEAAAWGELEAAFTLDQSDARVLYEWDQLAKRMNHPPEERLARLEKHASLVAERDDLYIERVSLLNRLGRHDEALSCLNARHFHPWEGGEGKVTGQYVFALREMARQQLEAGDPRGAIALLERARTFPDNLGEGKLANATENDIHYWLGAAYRAAGDEGAALDQFERAATGASDPVSAVYYNDQPPDMIFYRGLALRALGRDEEAGRLFDTLTDYGTEHLEDDVKIDYFAVSLPDFLVFEDDLNRRNAVHCHYLIGLGRLGRGEMEPARLAFRAALDLDANHLGARTHLRMAETTR
jgi:tetratricopeptide (TPR) repeat protein